MFVIIKDTSNENRISYVLRNDVAVPLIELDNNDSGRFLKIANISILPYLNIEIHKPKQPEREGCGDFYLDKT